MSEMLHKRLRREKAARQNAEAILEKKSRELFQKNKELNAVNEQLQSTLDLKIEELQETEAEKFSLFENAIIGIVLTVNERVIKTNNTFSQMIGSDINELLGINLNNIVHLKDFKSSMEKIQQLKSGSLESFTIENRYKRANNSYFWTNTHFTAIRNLDGNIKYLLLVIEDIQDKKIQEFRTRSLVNQLKESNEYLENFAHLVSHDLKAPLNGIRTVMNWVEESEEFSSFSDEMKKYIELVDSRSIKMQQLINGIISYSKATAKNDDKEIFNVTEVIENTLQFLYFPDHIRVKLTGISPEIYANKLKIEQVFNNLIDNSIKHIDKKEGLIEINCYEDEKYWIFSIRDNGVGIEKKYFNKIFEMFNSLSSVEKSSGIGLAIVKKIVHDYGGTITLKSEVDCFSDFIFTFAKEQVSNKLKFNNK